MALSDAAYESMNASQTDEVWLVLLEITSEDLPTPIRVVNNNEDIIHLGETFLGYPFEINLPDANSESLPKINLQIDNIDRTIVDSIRQINTEVFISIKVVLASQPNVIDLNWSGLRLTDVSYDAKVVRGSFGYENIQAKKFPKDSYNPSTHPGMF